MIKSKKQMFLTIIIFTLVMMLGTISYAFFNYTRTGSPNNFSVGRLYFNSNQSETVNLSNAFPIDRLNVNSDTDNVDVFEIEIVGDADYENGIEYLVSIENTNIYTSEGKVIPIGLDVTVTNLGTEESNYFTERNDKDTTIYKRMTGNTISGNQPLLVGYIKPNTTSGTIEGVNGKITIKAFIDNSRIAITNTYNGLETDEMGTTMDWVDDRVVVTESEWNSLHSTGINFQVKVEANDGIWVNEPFYDTLLNNSTMDNINSDYVDNTEPGIDFSIIASDTNGKGLYTLSSTVNDAYPILYYRGDIDNNNVKFANKCWKMVRTTDTGGIKMVYNGEYTSENKCDNTGDDTIINVEENETTITSFAFNDVNNSSIAYVGYMYGDVYPYYTGNTTSGAYYGSGFTYDDVNEVYTLVDTVNRFDASHRYTCNSTSASATCQTIRYYVVNSTTGYYYLNISDGDNYESVLNKMRANTTSSTAKTIIDDWYSNNLSEYTSKLEDTIWCNDRRMYGILAYMPFRRAELATPSIRCADKIDSFSVSSTIGNGALTYPVAMLTSDEFVLAGTISFVAKATNYYLNNGTRYWTLSPGRNYVGSGKMNNAFYLILGENRPGGLVQTDKANANRIRPAISLKQGTSVKSGDGTKTNPYVIE